MCWPCVVLNFRVCSVLGSILFQTGGRLEMQIYSAICVCVPGHFLGPFSALRRLYFGLRGRFCLLMIGSWTTAFGF